MANINRDYLVIADLKNGKITSPTMSFYNTDKNIANLFVKLQITMSTNPNITGFVSKEEANDYNVKLTVIKPKTTMLVELEGVIQDNSVVGNGAVYLFDMPKNFTDQVGSYICELEITCMVNGREEIVTCDPFKYVVKGSVVTGLNAEIEANPDVEILRQLINEVKAVVGMTPEDPDSLLTDYQKKTDETLTTTEKEIPKAINEVNSQIKDNTLNKNSKEYYMINSNISPKLVYNSNGHIFIVSKKANGKGYIRIRLRDDIVDSSSSSAGGSAELLRPVEVLNCSECFVLTTSSYGDSVTNWVTTTLPYGVFQVPCKSLTSPTANAYVEYKITIPQGVNSIKALVWNSNASSDSVNISVDGVVKISNSSFKNSTSQWGYIYIPVTPGEHIIRFTTVNSGYMTIAGIGVVELKDWENGYSYDFFVNVSDTTNPYITNGGAIDYALWDSDTGLYCGSFHGGETRVSLNMITDGDTVNLTEGKSVICNIFEVEQQTNIASKINAYSRYIFKNDCTIEFEVYFNGNINLKALFTNMTTSHTNFSLCLYPRYVDTTTAGTYYMPRGCNYIVQKNPNTNQKIVTILNDNITGDKILPYIQASQYYNKVYKENIKSDVGVNFKEGNFKSVHYFE